MKNFLKEEFSNSEKKLLDLQKNAIDMLLPKDKYDSCQEIIMEVRAGVGGSESSLFADEVFNMY